MKSILVTLISEATLIFQELVRKLKNKLEFGVTDVEPRTAAEAPTKDDSVLLMKMNQRTGLVEPARSKV